MAVRHFGVVPDDGEMIFLDTTPTSLPCAYFGTCIINNPPHDGRRTSANMFKSLDHQSDIHSARAGRKG